MREILETLLTREGYQVRLASNAGRGPRAGADAAVRRGHRRHDDAGHGRHHRARRAQENRRRPAGADDHRVRVDRERDQRDEARRLRLHHQAVQERRGAGRAAQRAGAAPAGGGEPRAAPEPAGAPEPARRNHRPQPAHAPGLRPDHAGGAVAHHHPDQRRERHRQGAGGAGAAPEFDPRRSRLHHRQFRQPAARPARVEPVRPRQGRVHRRGLSEEGPVRARRQGHDLLRRDRQHSARDAGQAAARDPGARVHAPRRRRNDQGRRPHHRRDQRRSAPADGRGAVPRGSLLPAARDHRAAAGAARAEGRHSAADPAFPRSSTARRTTSRTSSWRPTRSTC